MSEYQPLLAARTFCLKSFDAVGFDMDDCLANYNYQPLFSPAGCIAYSRVVSRTAGLYRIAVVNVCSLLFCADEYYMMESVFDIPAGDLYARLVDTFDEKRRQEITNYSRLWGDVVEALENLFPDDKLADKTVTRLKNDIGVYIRVCSPSVRRWLKSLRQHKKPVFLLTNSYPSIVSVVLQHILGNDWETYFDVVVCRAHKPTFYQCNPRNELKKVGGIYQGGNSNHLVGLLAALTETPDPKVVYFGDSTMNDIFPSKHFAKWSTVQILNDIDRCVTSEDGKESIKDNASPASTYWGSYVTDTSDRITTRTLWDAAIRRYADIAIHSIDSIADLHIGHEFEAFTPGVQNSAGYYDGQCETVSDVTISK
ncbi:hypothetical protein LSAT2_023666 [Lamellibrachia satsuma]|nr:hypothetical protein LSAT2_023666 [Lamellibrachia satsuma]